MSTEIQRISETYDVPPESGELLAVLERNLALADRIAAALGKSQRSLPAARVLDIGCGNTDERQRRNSSFHPETPRQFEPWLARILAARGAHVTGLDHSEEAPRVDAADGGDWTYVPHDLKIQAPEHGERHPWPPEAPSLPVQGQFDVTALVNVIHTTKTEEGATGPWYNYFRNPLEYIRYARIRAGTIEQAMAHVAPQGMLVLNNLLYTRDPESGLFIPADATTRKITQRSKGLQKPPFETAKVSSIITKLRGHYDPDYSDGDGGD